MTTFSLAPAGALTHTRAGFDPQDLLAGLLATPRAAGTNYPPYNIEQTGPDRWRVTLAVAGFGAEDIEVTVRDRALVVEGKRAEPDDEAERRYLHRGIGLRSFTRAFRLVEHVEVLGASLANGLLAVDLERVIPEERRAKSILIRAAGADAA